MANKPTYDVDEEDGIFYVFDSDGKAVASYCDEGDAQEYADKLTKRGCVDREEEASAKADHLYDQMRDRQMFGEDY